MRAKAAFPEKAVSPVPGKRRGNAHLRCFSVHMRSTREFALRTLLIFCFFMSVHVGAEETSLPRSAAADTAAVLEELKAEQANIRQRTLSATKDSQLSELDTAAQQLRLNVNSLLSEVLLPARTKLQTQLDVLGPASAQIPDAPAIAQQRLALAARQADLDAELKEAQSIRDDLVDLHEQISRLQRGQLKDQLALRSKSILSPTFWMPVTGIDRTDHQRLRAFVSEVHQQLYFAWQPGRRLGTLALLMLALVIWTLGVRLALAGTAWLCQHHLPDGRLRRSLVALVTATASVLSTAGSVQLVASALTRNHPLTPPLGQFVDELMQLSLTCAAIAGLGKALLSTTRPSWRLSTMADEVALAIRPFPTILAVLLMLSGMIEQINRTVDISVQMTLFGRGVVSLVVSIVIGAALLRANRARTSLAVSGRLPEERSTLAGIIHAGVTITIVMALIALLLGYITLARFLTYELVWVDLVLCCFYLFSRFIQDVIDSAFSARHTSGKTIKQLFGLDDVRLDQVSTLLSGLGASLLLLTAVIALLTGGFGTTPSDLIRSVIDVLGGQRLRGLNIVPSQIFNALLTLAVGLYLLRSLRRWLADRFLPKTGMGAGMRASLLTLLSNIGYVLIALLTFSALGVRWDNLAWIVSALSVGIGFGLQEIVKNFISGLILLTERPVKVGDMVSIAGVEGDIRRINVRATEIQLGDRSTVIVPNSQFISQNVRNVTMDASNLGVATLALVFPLDIDPEQVRDLLLATFVEHTDILEEPAPSVLFSQLAPDGITLSVTGYVRSPRITGTVKSDLLFEMLKRLRAAGITLSNPQTVMVRQFERGHPLRS